MGVVLEFMGSPVGAPVGLLAAAAVFVAVFPLRGGRGQHAGAGPGAISVWQIREAARPRVVRQPVPDVFAAMTDEECRAYLEERARRKLAAVPPPYVGKHRLAVEDLVEEFHPKVDVTLDHRVLQHGVWC
ncbi:hypothetical protein ABT337_14475 [Saccharopolyspora hirsuta]|uniref:hypothetical protein n=1 Tax=Saccharopolyspora hirsuta TaxID=1837 RepID=UPI00332261AD